MAESRSWTVSNGEIVVAFRRIEFAAAALYRPYPLLAISRDRPVDGRLAAERFRHVAATQDFLDARLCDQLRKYAA